jgi:NitT/TauT family transport system substrate-binding protein
MKAWLKSSAMPLVGVVMAGTLTIPQLSAQELQDISLRLAFTAGGIDAPTFVAAAKGYFEEEGLNVTIVDGDGSTGTIQAVGNGSFNIGIAGLGALAQASANAGFDNITAVFGLVQKDPSAIIALEGSGITEPRDIEGKRFATEAGNLSDGMISAFAAANDIDLDSIELIVTSNYMQALLRGDADFINGWANPDGDHVARVSPIEPPILFADWGVNILGSSVIVRKDWLAENEEAVRGVLRALTRAHADVLADPAEALEIFMEARPDSNREGIENEIRVMEAYRKTARSADLPFGHIHSDDIVQTIELLEEYSGMPTGFVTPEMIYTDAYLPE